ncbi:hypothetical protein ASE86_02115 [Sphingomonas sp. Leaf33]|uniref:glycoside hydrolase family 75 protein n=1 Tax=Sphingomonas sp. Leaf33 TaxID=1736215 RepID=UPI0006F418AD|nr:glycoside hydrolase family 75 protein [Sphingomonas sp. Leaf33]KQN25083.1 hypothetical protein ASE86_02115 [Sphingomonas sp. Leaf33]
MNRAFLAIALVGSAPATAADFRPWTDFPGARFKGTQLWRDAGSGAYCYATDHSRVDADGAPDAYHPDDRMRSRPPYLGLDNPQNAGWPQTGWWPDVLTRDPANPKVPYRQQSGPYRGYFVSHTALRVRGGSETDPATFADSRTIPYIVLPGSDFPRRRGTGAPGDVGWAWNLATGKGTAFVIGDTGGGAGARLGEASIAFFKALGGTAPNARTGAGVAPGTVRFVVFPGSRRTLGWPATPQQVTTLARQQVDRLGGAGQLKVCGGG